MSQPNASPEVVFSDDEDMPAAQFAAHNPIGSSVALRHGEVIEDEGIIITPQNIAVQYYRRETLRMATIAIPLAVVDLFITPIDAFILLPSAIAASYWLRDTVRFSHGGDLRKCFNRDCALMYFHVCCGVALAISALDCFILISNVSSVNLAASSTEVPTSIDTPVPSVVKSHSSSDAPSPTLVHSSSWYALAIGVNACSFVTLLYGYYCIRKLRRLLEQGHSRVDENIVVTPHVQEV
jgi:hypothetical protein